MGVPARLFSVPSERSVAIPIAMFCRLAPRMPAAMIPAMKYWVKLTPLPRSKFSTAPKTTSSSTGSISVKTTASRWRKNSLSSTTARERNTRASEGRATSEVVIRRAPRSSAGTRPRGSGRATARSGTSPGKRAASSRTSAVGVAVSAVRRLRPRSS